MHRPIGAVHFFALNHCIVYADINNVVKETAFTGATPELAFQAARQNDPRGIFHLIRIGYAGAFQVSFQFGHGIKDWIFG